MGLLRVLLVALFGLFALVAGLFTAAAVSLAGALILAVRRMLRQYSDPRLPSRGAQRFPSPRAAGEVIDVTATEVPADSTHR